MKINRLLTNDAGFTLIEALVAIAIFAIGMMAVGALQARSLMSTGDVARKTEAWTILDEQVTMLKNLPFYQNPATQTFTPALDENGGGFAHQVNRQMNGTYTVHWMVEDDTPIGQQNAAILSGLPAGNYTVSKEITVVVTRQGGDPLVLGDHLAQTQFIKTWAATDL